MLLRQNYEPEFEHCLFVGTDIKELRYSFIKENVEMGKVHIFVDNEQLYLDWFEIKEGFRRSKFGTKMLNDIFVHYPRVKTIWAKSDYDTLNGFWAKQEGFVYKGEGHDENEGYFWFEINRVKKQ